MTEVLSPAREKLQVLSTLCKRIEVVQVLMDRMMVLSAMNFMFLNHKDIRMRKEKGRGSRIWLSCSRSELVVVLKVVCRSVEGKQILVFVMEASSESTGSSPPALFIESDIRDLQRDVKELQRTMEAIDTTGGRRSQNLDRDMVFL